MESSSSDFRGRMSWAWILVLSVAFMALLSIASEARASDSLYRAVLDTGETEEGFRWAIGIKGAKNKPLKHMCEVLGIVEPPDPGSDIVEVHEGATCGRLLKPEDSVSMSAPLGSPESRQTLLAILYRPIVRRVSFLLHGGEVKVFRTRGPQIKNRKAQGIPYFRFLAATFEGEPCIRRVITFDGEGRRILKENRPPCPPGQGNG